MLSYCVLVGGPILDARLLDGGLEVLAHGFHPPHQLVGHRGLPRSESLHRDVLGIPNVRWRRRRWARCNGVPVPRVPRFLVEGREERETILEARNLVGSALTFLSTCELPSLRLEPSLLGARRSLGCSAGS